MQKYHSRNPARNTAVFLNNPLDDPATQQHFFKYLHKAERPKDFERIAGKVYELLSYDPTLIDKGWGFLVNEARKSKNPAKAVEKWLDNATKMPSTRKAGSSLWRYGDDGMMEFVKGIPCTKCENKATPASMRHSVCDGMLGGYLKRADSPRKNPVQNSQFSDVHKLESFVDKYGVSGLLTAISEICDEKAEHIRSNWQDNRLAATWDKDAKLVSAVAARVKN